MDDAGLAGQVPVSAAIQGGVDPISWQLWVDGAQVTSGSGRQVSTSWDTATAHTNPLPAPNHAIELGYYFTDGKWGDLEPAVRPYTSTYYASRANYFSDPNPAWPTDYSTSLATAADAGRKIILSVGDSTMWSDTIDRAAPYWSQVVLIEAADEPTWTKAETETQVQSIRDALTARSLAAPPIYVTYTSTQVLTSDALTATGLDCVAVEAYVDPPGSPDSATNVTALQSYLAQALTIVPADKCIVFVMMAYARNGLWTDISTLADLQEPTYLAGKDDPRVKFINMFSYGRASGTAEHPELIPHHMRIAERALGRTVAALSNGAHHLELRASSATEQASAAVDVTVQN
jgi:hypothetical protein